MNHAIGSWPMWNRALEDADGAVANVPAIGDANLQRRIDQMQSAIERHRSLRAIVGFAGGFFRGRRCIGGWAGFVATANYQGEKQNECPIMFHARSGDSC